jgi:hypothetical protein
VLYLEAYTGTNAVPTKLQANGAIIPPEFPIRTVLASRARKVPIRFQLLPYLVNSVPVHFTLPV